MSTATTTTITGNLTRDPEIRYTRDGQATTSLGVAVNRRWQNRETNEWEESTSFFDVVTWRDLAENVALSLTKGMRVVVTGRLEQRSWETEEGDRRFKVEIVADEVGASLRFATVDVHKVERAPGRRDAAGSDGASAARRARTDGPKPGLPDAGTADPRPAVRFAPSVRLTKAEVFSRLPGAGRRRPVPVRAGRPAEAGALGDLFELLEEVGWSPALEPAVADRGARRGSVPGRARSRSTASSRSSADRSVPGRRGRRGRGGRRSGRR